MWDLIFLIKNYIYIYVNINVYKYIYVYRIITLTQNLIGKQKILLYT